MLDLDFGRVDQPLTSCVALLEAVVGCKGLFTGPEDGSAGVLVESEIGGGDGDAFGLGLGDEHAIKRVFVVRRKRGGAQGVGSGDLEGFGFQVDKVFCQVGVYGFRERKLAGGDFYAEFPDAGNREPYFVAFAGDRVKGGSIEAVWFGEPPQ